jgi:hypothetical protein
MKPISEPFLDKVPQQSCEWSANHSWLAPFVGANHFVAQIVSARKTISIVNIAAIRRINFH